VGLRWRKRSGCIVNIKAMIVSELKKKRDAAAAELAAAEAALGYFTTGAVPATGKAVVKTSGKKGGGWPKGKKRGPKTPAATSTAPVNGSEVVSDDLAAKLAAIKADTTLTPIQKAQQSRAARIAAAKSSPSTSQQGAELAEAAS
jgi:hypothetical protein